MRPATEMPRRRGRPVVTRWRILIAVIVVLLLILLFSLRGLASFWTDYLWYQSLGFGSVWRDVLVARIGLGVLFTLIFFAFCLANLAIADRIAPRTRPPGPEEELVQRWQQLISGRAWLVRIGVSAVLALIAGVGVSGRWEEFLLFVNRVDFGWEDPQFGRDAGFYVFQLPFLTFLVTWTFTAIITVAIVTAVAHYLNGGIRLQTRGQRVTPQVKAHLSLLLALLALVKAAGYYLDRFELVLSTRGFRDGAGYTDVHAQLPAISLLILISLFSFGLLIFNIWARGWVYPAAAVGLWALVAFIAGTVYPALVQRFQVEPAESAREEPYIARNIEATRFAMGLDEVTPRTFAYDPALTPEEVEGNLNTVENVRILDPGIVDDTFQELQGFRGFYSFRDIDVDRYMIDGRPTQVVLSARELRSEGLPNRSWESANVAFTHGYGLAVAPANEVDNQGEPRFVVGDIPTLNVTDDPNLDIEDPGLYFGEGLGGYAVVGAERDEVDYEGDADTRGLTRYIDKGGTGGVDVSGTGLPGFMRRAAFALRFGEPNLLISGQVKDTSRILYIRDVRQRASKVAPFLNLDSDPYPVIIDGRIMWVLDGYTTTGRFPYAQQADTVSLPEGSALRGDFNYVRNSVKITIDAIDGNVTYWVIDPDDPLVEAYRKVFPTLFSEEAPPAELMEHFRYPEDLFRVQTNMWGRYRLGDPSQFYDGGAAWDVSQDPGSRIAETTTETVEDDEGVLREIQTRIDPQYLLLRLPEDDAESFLLFRPFVPVRQEGEGNTASQARRNLTGFMVARSDPENYGQLEVFDVSSAAGAVRGPVQFDAEAQANAEIARQISLLNQQGSQVEAGNLLLIPIENSLVYVRPLYVAAAGGNVRFPRLQQVIVGVGDRVEMRPTFEEALDAVVPGLALSEEAEPPPAPLPSEEGETPGTDDGETPTTPELPADVLDLLQQSRLAFERADAALSSGDLADYADAVDEARQLLLQAELRLRELEGLPPPAAEGTTPPTTAPAETTEPEGGAASEA